MVPKQYKIRDLDSKVHGANMGRIWGRHTGWYQNYLCTSQTARCYIHMQSNAPNAMCVLKVLYFRIFATMFYCLAKRENRQLDFGCHQNFCTICDTLINFLVFSTHINFWTNAIFIAPTCEYSDIIVFNICGSISDVKHCSSLVIMRRFCPII